MTLLGSTPQLAAITTFGSACSIRVQSSLAAKPDSNDMRNLSKLVRAGNAFIVGLRQTFTSEQFNKSKKIKYFHFPCMRNIFLAKWRALIRIHIPRINSK